MSGVTICCSRASAEGVERHSKAGCNVYPCASAYWMNSATVSRASPGSQLVVCVILIDGPHMPISSSVIGPSSSSTSVSRQSITLDLQWVSPDGPSVRSRKTAWIDSASLGMIMPLLRMMASAGRRTWLPHGRRDQWR